MTTTEGCGLRVSVDVYDGQVQVDVDGEVDIASLPVLRWALESAQTETAGQVVMYLRHLRFMDCSGVSYLERLAGTLTRSNGRLVLRHPSPAVARVIDLCGLADVPGVQLVNPGSP